MTRQDFRPPSIRLNIPRLHPVVWFMAAAVLIGSWVLLPHGGRDWHADIGPAARAWWPAPWKEGLPLPPYAALILSPGGGLPDRAATAITNSLSVLVIGLVIGQFGGPAWAVVPVLLSPAGFWLWANGQTEWLVLSGLLIFNGFDVLLLTLKPQVAAWVVVARIRRAGVDWRKYLRPAVIILLLSLVIWFAWPLHLLDYVSVLIPAEWNASLWPWSVPAGVYLVWRAWKTGDDRYGLVASPLLFPYVNWPSYLGVLAVIVSRWPRTSLVIWAATWLTGGIVFFIL